MDEKQSKQILRTRYELLGYTVSSVRSHDICNGKGFTVYFKGKGPMGLEAINCNQSYEEITCHSKKANQIKSSVAISKSL